MFQGSDVLDAMECERLVEALKPITLESFGSPEWKSQREVVEKLNIQAHHNINCKKDEFVYEALHSFEKLPIIVHELLVIEVWKEKVYPLRKAELRKVPTIGYMYYHYEAILVNLLEGLLFNDDAIESLGDFVLELCDYCYRKCLYLNAIPDEDRMIQEIDKEKWIHMSEEEYADRNDKESTFKIAMGAVSVLWMIIDKLPRLHMSVMNNLLLKNDMPLQLISLISGAPWMRRGRGKFQKFKEGEWVETPAHELLLLTPRESHVWLCLHMLLCEPTCRSKYKYDDYRKAEVLKLRRYVTPRLVDQIPNLQDLQRSLDELQIMEPPSLKDEAFRSTFVVEPMPEIYSRLVKGKNWAKIAEHHVEVLSNPETLNDDIQKMSQLIDQLGDWDDKVAAADSAKKEQEVKDILTKAGIEQLP